MKYLDLTEIEKMVFDFAQKIKAPRTLLPTFGFSRDWATHISKLITMGIIML